MLYRRGALGQTGHEVLGLPLQVVTGAKGPDELLDLRHDLGDRLEEVGILRL